VFTIVATVTLPYPAEAVFAALASVEGTVRWQSGVRCVRRGRAPDADAGAPGAAPGGPASGDPLPPLVLHYWALGVRHALRTRVTAHQPPEHFAYRAEGERLAYHATFDVAPAPVGCHVTCTVALGREREPDADSVRLRRLLARRLPRDLARLEAWVAVQPGARRRAGGDPVVEAQPH
jgi:hypothetical protein